MNRLGKITWLSIFCLQVLLAALLAWIWLDWHNTLAENGQWVVAKRGLALAVIGSESFYYDRQAIAGGQLDLSSWHGYHQVTYQDQLDIKQLHVNFDMDESSYLYFLFGSDGDEYFALRLSTNRMYRNAWLRIKNTGEFIETNSMPAAKLVATNNKVSFLVNQDRNEVGVILNGDYYGNFPVPSFFIKSFGFRGGANSVRINHVMVRDFSNQIVVNESFDNQKGWLTLASRLLAVLLIIDAVILLIEIRITKPTLWGRSRSGNIVLLLAICLLLIAIVVGVFQRYFASRYSQFTGWFTNIFVAEKRYLEMHSLEMTESFFKQYSLEKHPNTRRILVVGSSQTWGAGASQPDEGMVSVMNTMAASESATLLHKYEFIPTAVSGQMAGDLYTLYEQHWQAFKPDMVLVNLSNNDENEVLFKENLERFAQLLNKEKIPLIFVLEANSTESRPVLANHAIMRQVAEKYHIPVIDAHAYMATQEQTGILWWDNVHPTTYGHKVLGSYIYQNIKQQLTTL